MAHNSPELVSASLDGDLAAVRQLVAGGADANSTDEHGIGPLLTSDPAVTEFLLSHGADPNRQTNENGAPVLFGVAYMNGTASARLLLAAGANPKIPRAATGEAALHACLAKPDGDRIELVRLLLQYGADPNLRTQPGVRSFCFWRDVRTRAETPLHRAAAYAPDEILQLLLSAGADKTIRDVNGDSPQSWASWHWRSKSVIDLLDPS